MGVCGCGCVWVWVCVGVGVFGCAISATSRARQRQTRRCRRRFRPRRSATAVSSGVGHPAPPRRIEIERKINRRRRVQRFLRQSRLFSFAPNLSRCCCRFFFLVVGLFFSSLPWNSIPHSSISQLFLFFCIRLALLESQHQKDPMMIAK